MKVEVDLKSLKKFYDKKETRKLRDMRNHFKNPEGIRGSLLIYVVYRKSFGGFETGLNIMEHGTINKEFFMTKGHSHKKPWNEIYILLQGKGKLLIQNKKIKIINLKKNKIYLIPGKSGHRLVNTGNKKLEVLTIYNKSSKRGYKVNFKKRIMKK